MIHGIVTCLLGIWMLFIGLGKVKVSRNPSANALFMSQWGKWFLIFGPALLLLGIVFTVGSIR